jgi:hypothetical protein
VDFFVCFLYFLFLCVHVCIFLLGGVLFVYVYEAGLFCAPASMLHDFFQWQSRVVVESCTTVAAGFGGEVWCDVVCFAVLFQEGVDVQFGYGEDVGGKGGWVDY